MNTDTAGKTERAALIVAGLSSFLGPFMSSSVNVALPFVGKKFAVSAMRQIGMMLSMGIVMMILALILGQSELGPENQAWFLTSMRIAFVIFAVMCFGGIFASLARGRMNRGAPAG